MKLKDVIKRLKRVFSCCFQPSQVEGESEPLLQAAARPVPQPAARGMVDGFMGAARELVEYERRRAAELDEAIHHVGEAGIHFALGQRGQAAADIMRAVQTVRVAVAPHDPPRR